MRTRRGNILALETTVSGGRFCVEKDCVWGKIVVVKMGYGGHGFRVVVVGSGWRLDVIMWRTLWDGRGDGALRKMELCMLTKRYEFTGIMFFEN